MSLESLSFIVVYVCAAVSAWLVTYAIHSTLIIAPIALMSRSARIGYRLRERAWKMALLGGAISTTAVLLAGIEPLGGRYETGSAIESFLWHDAPRSVPQATGHETTGFPGRLDGAGAFLRYVPVAAVLGWLVYALFILGRVVVLTVRTRDSLGIRSGAPQHLRREVELVAKTMGLSRPVAVTVSRDLMSPIVLGRTEITIPEKVIAELQADEQRSVLAHEVAHIIRRDPWWLLVAATVESLFFFQLFNRMARVKWQEQSEYVCDEMAAGIEGTPLPLARSLVKVAEWSRGEPAHLLVPAFTEQPSSLLPRVQALLGATAPSSRRMRYGFSGALAAVMLTVTAAAPAVGPGSVRGWGTRAFHWAEVIPAGKTLEVQGVLGGILAVPSANDSAYVVATRHGKASNPDIRFEVVRSPSGVAVCAVYPTPPGRAPNVCIPGATGQNNTKLNDVEIEFVLHVPSGVAFAASSATGDIKAQLLDAPVTATSGSGNIDIATTAYAAARSGAGNVRVAMGATTWERSITIESGSGNVSVTLPRSASVEVMAESRTGRLKSEFDMRTEQTTGVARWKPRGSLGSTGSSIIGRGGRELMLRSIAGNITIRAD